MNGDGVFPAEGGCTCGFVRYRLVSEPLFVHCCHCTWCQRETGSAFVLNAMIEAQRMQLVGGEFTATEIPTESGKGQKISRCPRCLVVLYSNYSGAGERLRFVRVGTLDNPRIAPPDIHIYTASKQPWVILPVDIPRVSEYYRLKHYWPASSRERLAVLKASARAN